MAAIRPGRLIRVVILAAFLLVALGGHARAQPEVSGAGDEAVHIELYHSESCAHCQVERAFLADLVQRYPEVTVTAYELTGSAENRDRLASVATAMGFDPSGVPITIFRGQVWIGFGATTAQALESGVVDAIASASADQAGEDPVAPSADPAPAADQTVAVPGLGDVDVGQQSLVAATLLIGLLDGVNPCSLWVLSLLLALVVHTGSRRRVLAVGAVFLTITTLMYGLLIAGVYGALSVIAYLTWVRAGVAFVAGTMGAVNVLDAFGVDLPVRLRIPDGRKPGIYRRMRVAARADGSLVASLGATAALAVGVSLVEAPCTLGFPVLWSNLVASSGVPGAQVGALFALYMLVYLIDELVIFALAVVTLRATKLQDEHGVWLKLAGGVVMLTLAAVLLIAPDLLESLGGTLVVFGLAGVTTALAGLWLRRRRAAAGPGGDVRPPVV